MKIHLGYVAMAIDLKNCSPSKTISYTNYTKIIDEEVKIYKLKKITEENLINTKRILLYNVAHNIKVYRLTSKLVPLVTHPNVIDWDYTKEFYTLYDQIKKIILENELRISAHPDHFTILSSPKKDVIKSSIKDLEYHSKIMNAMGLNPQLGKLVLHIGGKYDSKEKTKKRFMSTFSNLPKDIKERIILENDDKIYDVNDVLELSEELKVPMVLDIHHHWCNNRNSDIEPYLERIFNTWKGQLLVPKIHISSPKSDKDFRAHADNIDFDFFFDFVNKSKQLDMDYDIMIEAKNKNLALFDLMEKIKNNGQFKVLDNATIEI